MNSNPGNGMPDRAFEQDLDTVHAAWQGLRHEEPPALLDQSVRNAARLALASRNRGRSLRWIGALATAAIVVLALAIVVQQDQVGPVPPAPRTDGFRLDDAAPAAKSASDEIAAEQGPARGEPRLQPAAPASLQEADALQPPPTADEWIEQMRQLRQTGRLDELRVQMEAFRQTWPDYPLPPDLQN
jgi:hypothetical protein